MLADACGTSEYAVHHSTSLTVGSASPVGNKNDDPDRKVVLTADAQTFAQQMGIQLFETSAKENINVEEVMMTMMTMMSTFIAHDSINSVLSALRSVRRSKGIIIFIIDCVYILYCYSLPSNRLTAFMSHVILNECIIFFVVHFVNIHVKLHALTSMYALKVQSEALHLYLFWFQWPWLSLSIAGMFMRNTGMVAGFCSKQILTPPPPPKQGKKETNWELLTQVPRLHT